MVLASTTSRTSISSPYLRFCWNLDQHKENNASGAFYALLLARALLKKCLLQARPVCSLKHLPSITRDLVAIRQIQVLHLQRQLHVGTTCAVECSRCSSRAALWAKAFKRCFLVGIEGPQRHGDALNELMAISKGRRRGLEAEC